MCWVLEAGFRVQGVNGYRTCRFRVRVLGFQV